MIESFFGSMTPDRDVPLSKALERFSDPREWNELRSLERYEIHIFVIGQPETERYRLGLRYDWLKQRLEAEFLDKLITGSLVATGFVWPIDLDAKRQVIPARRWRKLEPDFKASEATGGGLRITEIRVGESRPIRRRSSHSRPAADPSSREQASLAKLRVALRRWLEREAQTRGPGWSKRRYCEAARKEHGNRVTDNLFKEVWRSANLPGALRQPGLRKREDRSIDSSSSD